MPITFLLPLDRRERPPFELAPGVSSFDGARIGVVDNGLWRSMPVAVATIERELTPLGAAQFESIPFNHLAPDFIEQQHELARLGSRVHGAVVGLGN